MSFMFPSRLEAARHYLGKAKETIIHQNKRRHNLDKAEGFLFEKKRELYQTKLQEWTSKAKPLHADLLDSVNAAYRDTKLAMKKRDLNQKKVFIVSAWEYVVSAIKIEKTIRLILDKDRATFALDQLK